MTFSKFDEHSSPLSKQTRIIKFHDLATKFETFFVRVNEAHDYNTILTQFQASGLIMENSIFYFKVYESGIV